MTEPKKQRRPNSKTCKVELLELCHLLDTVIIFIKWLTFQDFNHSKGKKSGSSQKRGQIKRRWGYNKDGCMKKGYREMSWEEKAISR